MKRRITNTRKLTADQVLEIRKLLAAGGVGSDLAKQYGVSRPTISRIKQNTFYKEVKL